MDGSTCLEGHGSSGRGPLAKGTHAHVTNLGQISVPLMTSPGASCQKGLFWPNAHQKVEQNRGGKEQTFLWSLWADWSHNIVREISQVNFANNVGPLTFPP